MLFLRIFASLIAPLIWRTGATSEWFGDLRAHLNPARRPAFYDVTYDDSECSSGIQSNVIPEFVYFGEMVATRAMHSYTQCLHKCLMTERCKAVNFFESLSSNERGFCELLSESQHDNPRLMRPFRKASYYEKIRCKSEDEFDADESAEGGASAATTAAALVDNETGARASTLSPNTVSSANAPTTVAARTKPPRNEADKKAVTAPPSSSRTTARAPTTTEATAATTAAATAHEDDLPALKPTSATNLNETKNGANHKLSAHGGANNSQKQKSGGGENADEFVVGFADTADKVLVVDETADNFSSSTAAAPPPRTTTDAANEERAVRPTTRMTRDEMLRKLAAKVREFNMKFARN